MTQRRAQSGFTLIELLVTATIVAILATVALPLAELGVKRQRENELRTALRELRGAIDAYKQAADSGRITKKADATGYPPSLAALVDGVEDARDPEKERKIYFLRRLPRDPMHPDEAVPPADTWGKRTYASPPDEPKEGPDVYDVYSLSTGASLAGIPYRQW
ncbi:MAG TPA: type II secretion system protein [Gemmatimonadales bacterium]|nr:type II secretion system protein [Gemmatimonadales bacterium]